MGGDCDTEQNPWTLQMDNIMCDIRNEACNFATAFGQYFPVTGLHCIVVPVQVYYSSFFSCLEIVLCAVKIYAVFINNTDFKAKIEKFK